MRRQLFLAIAFAEGVAPEQRLQLRRRVCAAVPDYEVAFDQDDLIILQRDGPALPISGECGMILGAVHSRDSSSSPDIVDLSREVIESRGRALISARWGNYVAFIREPGQRLDVVRAPFGDLPCFIVENPEGIYFASNFPALVRCGAIAPRPDVTGLARFLLAEDICHPRTCIEGVTELLGGQRFELTAGSAHIRDLWSPWDHIEPYASDLGLDGAVTRLRETIVASVGRITQGSETFLLRLSGGLDSSILAAALRANSLDIVALNMVTENPAGDERPYARSVARHLGIPLVERFRSAADVDVIRSGAAGLPRPSARSFTQSTAQLSSDVAREYGATAVVDGGGGDQLFCSLRSARVAADCLSDRRGRGQFWSTCASVARLAEVSMFEVAWKAWGIHRRHSPKFDYPVDLRFLARDLKSESKHATTHRWLDASIRAAPGKAAHIAMLLQGQTIVRGALVNDRLPLISPLLSQPIVEACLRIPTWLAVAAGRDRAVARDAFASLLPLDVISRSAKGSPDSFVISLFERNRPLVRAMLLDGQLAGMGLLDKNALREEIDRQGPVAGVDFYRVMRLADAEAWLGSF